MHACKFDNSSEWHVEYHVVVMPGLPYTWSSLFHLPFITPKAGMINTRTRARALVATTRTQRDTMQSYDSRDRMDFNRYCILSTETGETYFLNGRSFQTYLNVFYDNRLWTNRHSKREIFITFSPEISYHASSMLSERIADRLLIIIIYFISNYIFHAVNALSLLRRYSMDLIAFRAPKISLNVYNILNETFWRSYGIYRC